jgi:DNA-binding transcriptional LysR family regulator
MVTGAEDAVVGTGGGVRVPGGSLELRELRYFVAAAEDLHFTRAARRLHIAQQALSSAIRQMEARLGTSLFERTTRQVVLTSAGEALLPRARLVLAAAEEATTAAQDAGRGVTASLNVGVSHSAGAIAFAVLRAMWRRAPGVKLSVRQDFTQPLVEALAVGDLDAALLFCPEQRDCLDYQRLSDEQALVVVHPEHRLAGRAELRVADLAEEILVTAGPANGRGYDAAVLALCQQDSVTPRTAQACGMLGPSGFAPSQTFEIATQTALDGIRTDFDLVRIPLQGATLPFDLAWHRDRDNPPLGMLRCVAAHCANDARWPRTGPQCDRTAS